MDNLEPTSEPVDLLKDEQATRSETRLSLAETLLLPLANNGEKWAIERLLGIVADAMEAGVSLPPALSIFVSAGLAGIADGRDLKVPFGIRRRRGGRDLREARARAYSHAFRVEDHRYNGDTLEKAIGYVAKEDSVSEHTVRANWKKNHKRAKADVHMARKYSRAGLG